MSAPALRNVVITSGYWLNSAASISGVKPSMVMAYTLAPLLTAACTSYGVLFFTSSKRSFVYAYAHARDNRNARATITTVSADPSSPFA